MNATYRAEPLAGVFRTIVEGQLAATAADPANPQWHSFWFILRKTDRSVVGSALFKDRPDPEGCVEIGYGLGPAFEGCGYMTEAVEALCGWTLRQPGVRHVTAETDADGYASNGCCNGADSANGAATRPSDGFGNLPGRSHRRKPR